MHVIMCLRYAILTHLRECVCVCVCVCVPRKLIVRCHAYLLKIGFSRITPANLIRSGKKFTGVYRPNSNLTCLAPWVPLGQRGTKWRRKGACFCNRYNELAFRTGQIGMKFGQSINRCLLVNLNKRILKHFNARRSYASAVLGVVILSVSLSVCPFVWPLSLSRVLCG